MTSQCDAVENPLIWGVVLDWISCQTTPLDTTCLSRHVCVWSTCNILSFVEFKEEGMAGPGNEVCLQTADFMEMRLALMQRLEMVGS